MSHTPKLPDFGARLNVREKSPRRFRGIWAAQPE